MLRGYVYRPRPAHWLFCACFMQSLMAMNIFREHQGVVEVGAAAGAQLEQQLAQQQQGQQQGRSAAHVGLR